MVSTETQYNDYNKFFHPNLCHVCKYKKQDKLKLCLGCSMISYCSEEHRIQHQPQHEEICKAIKKLKNLQLTCGMTKNEWITHRKNNLQDIQSILCRTLKPYEKQMFLLAKSCEVCHEQHMVKLGCYTCVSINKCNEHMSNEVTHKCADLMKSLRLDIYDFMERKDEKIPSFYLPAVINDDIVKVANTKTFVELSKPYDDNNDINWKFFDYIFSDAISGPLTLCNMMINQKLTELIKKNRTFVIHIVTGSLTDKQSLSAWEIVLHMLFLRTELRIIMIELELESIDDETWDVCDICRASEKKLCFEIYAMLYKEYTQCSYHVPPNIIIGLQAEPDKLTANTIKTLQNQNCPLLLTTITADIAEENVAKINKDLSIFLSPLMIMKNKFQSHRPYRNLEEEVHFHNQCVIFYDKLQTYDT